MPRRPRLSHSRAGARGLLRAALALSLLIACNREGPHAVQQTAHMLKGQVVCSSCWSEAEDRRATPYGTEDDITCAGVCASHGVPQALAVWSGGEVKLYLLEGRGVRPAGGSFIDYISDEVEVSGEVSEGADGKARLKVDSLRLLSRGPAHR